MLGGCKVTIKFLVHPSSTGKSRTPKKLFSVPAGTYCSLTQCTAGHTAYLSHVAYFNILRELNNRFCKALLLQRVVK
jgi:hypothetical protein